MIINGNGNGRKSPATGILEWFRVGEYDHVEQAVSDLRELGITHLRSGISWADWYTEEGREWISWFIPRVSGELKLLPCFTYTPPSIGIEPKTSSPPANPDDFTFFVAEILSLFGRHFEWVELWNEPNNTTEWDWRLDPHWEIFSRMIKKAASHAKKQGKKVVLGGMSPIDPNWLNHMFYKGVMKNIDVVGIHGFPDVFDTMWKGWRANLAGVQAVLDNYNSRIKIWITESGFSTWQHDEFRQLKEFIDVSQMPVERIYWYSLYDLDTGVSTIDGFHIDDREYFFGLKREDRSPKLLYRVIADHGTDVKSLKKEAWLTGNSFFPAGRQKPVMITGGAGFVGTNVAVHYLEQGRPVLLFDNLTRVGVENNFRWLKETYGEDVYVEVADIRNRYKVQRAAERAERIFHFAAQVAVTTSLTAPLQDFSVNAAGTLNILEAIRSMESPPPLVFTSTNKVYGSLEEIPLVLRNDRYLPESEHIRELGIDESASLDFHSPYGCSKGTADQYIIDYARIYGLPAVVFRMSCIYGPHQHGNVNQGWVAHLMIQALQGKQITIYGDGKQVRDLLFVEDLVRAFDLAMKHIDTTAGRAFNIGGGPGNVMSMLDVLEKIRMLNGNDIRIIFDEWRTGDQRYYASNTGKFRKATGWQPQVDVNEGLSRLYAWLAENEVPVFPLYH